MAGDWTEVKSPTMSPSRLSIEDPFNAFCTDTEAFLPGATSGPLTGLTFAAKDIFDVAGHVTGAGNPDWKATHQPAEQTAWAVQVLVDAGATLVGKTHTDELTRGIYGENAHYGTPINPRAPDRVPGGSSSGSAAAVAGGLVDFALGSDTGGSVRIPASFCGIYGLRPTHGRISMQGVLHGSTTYDTIGFFARDAELFARVGEVLLQSPVRPGRPRHLIVAEDAFEATDPDVVAALQPQLAEVSSMVDVVTRQHLSPSGLQAWVHQFAVLAGRETLASMRDWIDRVNPRLSFEGGDAIRHRRRLFGIGGGKCAGNSRTYPKASPESVGPRHRPVHADYRDTGTTRRSNPGSEARPETAHPRPRLRGRQHRITPDQPAAGHRRRLARRPVTGGGARRG